MRPSVPTPITTPPVSIETAREELRRLRDVHMVDRTDEQQARVKFLVEFLRVQESAPR